MLQKWKYSKFRGEFMKYINLKSRRYLGNKYSLIPVLESVIKPYLKNINSMVDLFAGTGVVGEYFLNIGKEVKFNDILYSNYIIYEAWFGEGFYDSEKILQILSKYNNLNANQLEDNYFSINFKDTYFSYENCLKIGYIREDIEERYLSKKINYRERAILVASLIYSIDRIANTVGHYDSFLINKSGLDEKMKLYIPNINGYDQDISIYRKDANDLVKDIYVDLVYIDPPYNSRQYCDLYHLLENIAEWKKPTVQYKAKKMDRTHIKSDYSLKNATEAFEDLIKNIKAKYILVSYNDMGENGNGRSNAKIKDEDLIKILQEKGKLKIIEKKYNAFNSGKSSSNGLKERFFLCEVKKNETKDKKKVALEKFTEKNFVKTSFNYTGGKFRLLPQLYEFFPKDLRDYTFIDLFTGGANVGINVNSKKIICNDKNKSVIRILNLFKKYEFSYIRDEILEIIDKYELSKTFEKGYNFYNCDSSNGLGKYNKNKYLQLRENYNQLKESVKKDIYLLVLISYSFNNQIRFNKKMEFNSPVGKRDFNSSNQKNMYETIKRINLLNIDFISKDFRDIDIYDYKNPFLYCDPPYSLGTATYNENGGWTKKDDRDLLKYLEEADKNGIKFALSNVMEHKGIFNEELSKWVMENQYNIIYLDKDYNNSSYHKNNKLNSNKTIEVLITNYIY